MAKKNARANDEVDGKVNLSPMIDCCFLLLIFFVVNATQITVAKDASIKMPSAVSCSDLKDANGCIVVNVFPEADKMDSKLSVKYAGKYAKFPGTVYGVADVNGETIGFTETQLQDLTDFLKNQKDILMKRKDMTEAKVRLYLRGDKETTWQRSSAVISCASKAGITNIVFGSLPAKS